MRMEHNSHNSFYRSPFGAVPAGSRVFLRVYIESYAPPSCVQVIVNDKVNSMYYLYDMAFGRVYEAAITLEQLGIFWYYFYAEADNVRLYFGNNEEGLGGFGTVSTEKPRRQYQITVYDENYASPAWMKHAVFYQIFPDRFYRGASTPIKGIKRNWGDMPYFRADQFGGEYLSNDFFGGNLQGITEKLPYLIQLGISAIYLNPIFEASTNHKYDTGNYEEVDKSFGGTPAFEKLCAAAESNGIKIVLDGVFNHTGSDSKYFNSEGHYDSVGAYQSPNSPYFSWYKFESHPDKYNCWWGFKTLPDLQETSDSLREYLLSGENSIIKRWLRAGASGWRLDVVDELPGFFVKELAKNVKEENPNAVIIGEVWEDASNKTSYGEQREYFLGQELDSVMNYPLRTAILDFLLPHGDANNFTRSVLSLMENYPKENFYSLLNIISSHDVARALTVLAESPMLNSRDQQFAYTPPSHLVARGKQRLKLAVLLQMSLPGAPCVYYGDEAGMLGYTDPFNRQCYPWGAQDDDLIDFFKKMIALRNHNPVLRTGEFVPLYWGGKLLSFARRITNGRDVFDQPFDNQTFVIAVNSDVQRKQTITLDLGRLGVKALYDYYDKNIFFDKRENKFTIPLEPLSARIFVAETDREV